MAEVKWIKIATEIFDNQKIRMIESMPEGDAIIVIWFKLLSLAGKVNDGGFVYFTRDIPYTEQMLSTYFNRPLPIVQMALNTFVKFGMMQIVDDIIYVSNWEEYQNVDGLARIREQTRKRVAKHREQKRLEKLSDDCNVTCNATVTQGNETDIEEDKEEDKEIEKIHRGSAEPSVAKLPKRYHEDDDLNEAIKEFIKHRKALKKTMTDRAIELFINKLNKLSTDKDVQIAMINEAIEKGWMSVYPLKDKPQSQVVKQEERSDLKAIEDLYMQEVGQ